MAACAVLLAALALGVVHRKQTDSLMELQKERYRRRDEEYARQPYRSTVVSTVPYLHVLDDDEY